MEIDIERVKQIDAIEDWNAKVLSAALLYAAQGFYVIPIRRNSKAIPEKHYGVNYGSASNKPATVQKWFGPGGKFEGWNVGLAAGRYDGIFVVDIDRHGDTDGIESWNTVTPDGWEHQGPMQRTPSGGLHLIYHWGKHGRSSTSKLGAGLDTRGGDEGKCQGHIVAWPSVVDGKAYQWIGGGEAIDMPTWISDLLGASWRDEAPIMDGPGRGNENMGKADLEDKFDLEGIKDMLSWIDPDELSYQEWLNVGMVIHSQHPGAEGEQIWDEWSKPGKRYESNEVSLRWRGFNPNGPVRIGTLIYMAKARGWSHEIIERDTTEIDKAVEELNREFAIVPMGSDIFVLQEKEVIPELSRIQPSHQVYKRSAFKALLENQFIIAADSEGKVGKFPLADVWLAHPERRTYPNGVGMFPDRGRRYNGYYNLWTGFVVEPCDGSWNLFRNHIKNVICNGESELFTWVLDWMADLYQDPANPKGCCIVLNGIEGSGKGTFAQMVGAPFGTHFKHVTDEEHFVGRFNGHLVDAVFVFADEVTYGGNKKVAGKLKALVTERFITAERKGIDAVQYHNCAHVVLASNEQWFIPAGPESRRWLVLEISGQHANDRQYFDAIHRQMEHEGGLGAMLQELLNREITSNLMKAPETEALIDQRAAMSFTDSVVAYLTEIASSGILSMPTLDEVLPENEGQWPQAIAKNDLYTNYTQWCESKKYRKAVSPNVFFKQVPKYGFKQYRPRVNGERIYALKVPELDAFRGHLKVRAGVRLGD